MSIHPLAAVSPDARLGMGVKVGAFASIEEGVAGLVHVSEFTSPAQLRETLELGKTYPFSIALFDPKDQRMTLTYKGKK